jgi:hypothetical protein
MVKASLVTFVLLLSANSALGDKVSLADVKRSSPAGTIENKYIIEVADIADIPHKRDITVSYGPGSVIIV